MEYAEKVGGKGVNEGMTELRQATPLVEKG